jgi:hypothetical protein
VTVLEFGVSNAKQAANHSHCNLSFLHIEDFTMHYSPLRVTALFGLAWLAGCATTLTPPDVPVAILPANDQSLVLEALATGVQIYECSRKADSTYEWIFTAPEASLFTGTGRSLGKHYAGPTWESNDGSTVVGEVKTRDPGPNPTAIPWLLLNAKTTTGTGAFTRIRSVQRVATVGGLAPVEACTANNLKQRARVPYTATYYFYH